MNTYIKDPSAKLDYIFDWSDWLAASETILSAVITAPTGITAGTGIINSGQVLTWITGGTAGTRYIIACKITTNAERIDERSIIIDCQNR